VIALFRTGRWIGYLVLTIVFSVIASLFGLWQWDRREAAVAVIALVEANYDQDPVAIEQLGLTPSRVAQLEWRQVVLRGAYVTEQEVLVRTRPRGGQVGFEILTPFRLDDQRVIAVNRGWVPTGSASDSPDVIPAPPGGIIELVGRIRPPEPALPGRGAPEGQLPSIDLAAYSERVDGELVTAFYLERVQETPPPVLNPVPAIRPVPDEGPHLSYTLQWFVFAIMAFVAYGWLLRSDYRAQAGIQTTPTKHSDADEEDALLDRPSI